MGEQGVNIRWAPPTKTVNAQSDRCFHCPWNRFIGHYMDTFNGEQIYGLYGHFQWRANIWTIWTLSMESKYMDYMDTFNGEQIYGLYGHFQWRANIYSDYMDTFNGEQIYGLYGHFQWRANTWMRLCSCTGLCEPTKSARIWRHFLLDVAYIDLLT